MKIRDSHAELNGDSKTQTMPSSSLDVVGDDGRTLFSVALKDGQLEVRTGGFCKHDGIVLDEKLFVIPRYANQVFIARTPYIDKDAK